MSRGEKKFIAKMQALVKVIRKKEKVIVSDGPGRIVWKTYRDSAPDFGLLA